MEERPIKTDMDSPTDDFWYDPADDDYDNDEPETCDGCGRMVNGCDNQDPCPLCCSHSYAPGSEQCDWCKSEQECYESEFESEKGVK